MLLTLSIAIEVAVAVIAVLAALKGRPHLYGLAFTFAVYVLYDLGRLLGWHAEGKGKALIAAGAAAVT